MERVIELVREEHYPASGRPWSSPPTATSTSRRAWRRGTSRATPVARPARATRSELVPLAARPRRAAAQAAQPGRGPVGADPCARSFPFVPVRVGHGKLGPDRGAVLAARGRIARPGPQPTTRPPRRPTCRPRWWPERRPVDGLHRGGLRRGGRPAPRRDALDRRRGADRGGRDRRTAERRRALREKPASRSTRRATTRSRWASSASPTGLLLIPDARAEVDGVRRRLSRRRLPDVWPPALRGHELAHADDLSGAAAFFAAAAADDAAAAFNHYVLEPEGVDTAALRSRLSLELQPLVDAVRYMLGDLDHVGEASSSAVEVTALVLTGRATELRAGGTAAGGADAARAGAVGRGHPTARRRAPRQRRDLLAGRP